MLIRQDRWYCVSGKAGFGKTYWIKAHLRKIPQDLLWILDYNGNDYVEFKKAHRFTFKVPEEIDDFLDKAYRQGDCFVVLGDCDSYIRKNEMSMTKKMFVNTARNRRIGAIFDAKRVFNLPPDVRGRINEAVLFRKTEIKDIVAHEEWAGESRGYFDVLRNLQVGENLIYDFDSSRLFRGVKVK